MKLSLCLISFLTFSTSVKAEQVLVFKRNLMTAAEQALAYSPKIANTFKVESSKGRVWVETKVSRKRKNFEIFSVTYNNTVPGLTLNNESNEIALNGQSVVCGDYTNKNKVARSENCRFSHKITETTFDTGLEVKKIKQLSVYLNY